MNTRFNPTADGSLHVGHVYMALLNEAMAHDTGGKFILRIDDNQRAYFEKLGGVEQMHELGVAQHRDLNWMGMQIDTVSYQSETEEEVKIFLAQTHFRMVIDHVIGCETFPIIRPVGPAVSPIQLSTWIVAEKVVLDRWEDVDAMVRGPEMLQEHALYMYFCALFGYRFPKCYYLPRLATAKGRISKTMGNWQVRDLRDAGATPGQIRCVLRESCLVDPAGPWHVDNVKHSPELSIRSIEDL